MMTGCSVSGCGGKPDEVMGEGGLVAHVCRRCWQKYDPTGARLTEPERAVVEKKEAVHTCKHPRWTVVRDQKRSPIARLCAVCREREAVKPCHVCKESVFVPLGDRRRLIFCAGNCEKQHREQVKRDAEEKKAKEKAARKARARA